MMNKTKFTTIEKYNDLPVKKKRILALKIK